MTIDEPKRTAPENTDDDTKRSDDSELSDLIKQYGEKLPIQIAQIARLLDLAREAGTNAALEPAKSEVHRLKGTAGSYGFMDISHDLEALEQVLKEGTECGALQWFRIAALVDSLMTNAQKEASS